ncbi:hypothetical protein MLD38_016431 [Melastoma candidum]|uniref:Uncharacterized protein n=1 Tax=Melastoma candidum TaxID=119954 RepID=A0ACB9RMI3_9MYRT|nr:hypothetical protein MLD38_016431 [Melastoma candidum]
MECCRIRARQCEEEFHLMEMRRVSMEELVVGCTKELEAKQEQIELVKTSLSNLSLQVEFERNKLDLIRKESSECQIRLEVKDQQLRLFHLTLDRCYEELCSKRSSLERHFYGEEELPPGFETVNPEWQKVTEPCDVPTEGTTFDRSNMFRKGFWETRVGGIDPAKEVLDLIQGPYEQLIRKECLGFNDEDLRVHILLLERLIGAASPVTPHIKASICSDISGGVEDKLEGQ